MLADYGETQGQFEAMGGYALEAEARKVLAGTTSVAEVIRATEEEGSSNQV